MNTKLNEDIFFNQLVEFDKKPQPKLLKNDIRLHGYIIKDVPVYPDFRNEPSENVSGDTLTRLYKLIDKNRNKCVIKYS